MTDSYSTERDSNVVPLFGRRDDPKAPVRLSEEAVAEFLYENFDIDVPVSTNPDMEGSSEVTTDELNRDIDRERRILRMATTVIYEQVDTDGLTTVRIVPRDDASAKWLREINIFRESLADSFAVEEPESNTPGSLVMLFDRNRDTEKDV